MMSKTAFWSFFVGIMIIVIANIIATEYRIKRDKAEAQKAFKKNGYICPACPACGPTT